MTHLFPFFDKIIMDLFCSGCRTEFKTQRALSMHLSKSSYCINKKRKYSSSPSKITKTQNETNTSATFSNNKSNLRIDDDCSMNDTSFVDSPIATINANNQLESENNIIHGDSIPKHDKTPSSEQDVNPMPDIEDPNKFFNDDWFNLLPNKDILNQQSTFSQKNSFGHKTTLSKFHYLNYFMRSKLHYTLLIK